jgi:HK97 family phage major capsid protein
MSLKNIPIMIGDRQKLVDEMKSLCDIAEKRESKGMTPRETTRWQELNNRVDQMEQEIVEEKRHQEEIKNGPNMTEIGPGGVYTADRKNGTGTSYRSMFYGNESTSLDMAGFASRKEYFDVICSARYDDRLTKLNIRSASAGVPSAGGYSVPEELGGWLLDRSLENEIVRPRAQIFPMSTESRKIPCFDTTDMSTGYISGFRTQWLSELGTATVSTPQLRQIQLTAKKLAIYTAASRELMESGLDFDSQLSTAMVNASRWSLDNAFLSGGGAGQPLGILNSPCTIKITRTASGEVSYSDIVNMYAKLLPGALAGAVWCASQTVLPQLMDAASRITVGTGGSYIPLVTHQNGQFTLLGLPLLITEKLPTLGNEGDVLLANFGYYAIGLRKELILEKSNAVSWATDAIDFRVILRIDGQPVFSVPVKDAKGTLVSPFVVLDNEETTTPAP